MKISGGQLGFTVASLGFATAAILWYSGFRNPAALRAGVRLSAVEHTVDLTGPVNCTVQVTNILKRRVVVQVELQWLLNDQWQIIPCRQPGPMYVSALWVLDPGEVKTVVLPTPQDRGNDVAYRIEVGYWVQVPALRIWREKLWDTGTALLGRKPRRSGMVIRGRRGDTPIDWPAHRCAYTQVWNSVQQTDAPDPAPALWLQFEGDRRGVGDP